VEVLKMAVKVMVAPAITKSAVERHGPGKATGAGEAARPRRRRSSVYDAEGHEVFITLMCLKCHKMRPLSQFGLRKMSDGAIRNQPWCRTCRSTAGVRGQAKESAETVDSVVSAGPPRIAAEPQAAQIAAGPQAAQVAAEPQAARSVPEEPRPRQGNLAAQVAAALAGGLGR